MAHMSQGIYYVLVSVIMSSWGYDMSAYIRWLPQINKPRLIRIQHGGWHQ